MRIWFLIITTLMAGQISAQTLTLKLKDSIIIKPSANDFTCRQINYINDEFVGLFHNYPTKNEYLSEIVVSNSNRYFFNLSELKTPLFFTSFLFNYDSGYGIIRYHAEKDFIKFETKSNIINSNSINLNFNKHILYANRNEFSISDGEMVNGKLLVSRNENDLKGYSDKKFIKSLKRYFEDENLLMFYDLQSQKVTDYLVKYPAAYKTNLSLFINRGFSFCADDETDKIYVSFDGMDNIYVYDSTGNYSELSAKGNNIMQEYLQTKEPVNLRLSALKDYYNLLVDNYASIKLFNDKIFRTYKVHYNEDDLQDVAPPASTKSCPTPSVLLKYYNLDLNKKSYLQQFAKDGTKEFEFSFPEGVNTFVGYSKEKNEYYFRKKIIPIENLGAAKIYVYKPQ